MNILNEIEEQSILLEEVEAIDAISFKKKYVTTKKPVLLKGYAKNWGATKKWNLDYLVNLADDKEIGVLSGNYIQGDIRYKKATLKDYLLKLKKAAENKESFTEYLTTLDIFNYLPNLKGDTDFSIFEKNTAINDIAAWIGPKGTVTGFHNDSGDNMYAQIKGEKLFILVAPDDNKFMYPSPKYVNGAIASKIDITNFDAKKYGAFKKARFYKVVLQPGDVLFLPKRWWHYVQSLDSSISISNFGYSKLELFKMRALNFLHRRGYYKSKNCYCCSK
ncbi:cupin-like domain-containing protein [Cellulophaga sp. F20128]|uniref:cupin-like domain-containing protein n=1 Tax=Cellulophaga sp. F20128 TaxID=2926413 RepID=UPI001FF367BA|nr:cupin-like domain-containing protein [Cellulophaga sp. F20128]MCK0156861.1 cupin-like domain-containing protein [Cellulophaga sp. F20128]